MLGRTLVVTTLTNISILFVGILVNVQVIYLPQIYFVILSLTMTLLALVSAALLDSIRRDGETTYYEIVDELQWYAPGRMPRSAKTSDELVDRPPLATRVALREFARASELPLLPPTRTAPLLYIMLNVVMTFLIVLPLLLPG